MTVQTQQPYVNTREDAAVRFLGLPTLMRSTGETTNGAFGLIEHGSMPPGFASPYHTHHREDEAFYVLEGEVAFVCDGKWLKAGPGTYVFGPREVPHGFRIVGSAPARMLLLCSPAGFEHFVLEQTTDMASTAEPDMAKMMELAATYDVDIHGALPDMPESFAGQEKPVDDLKTLNLRWIQAFNDRDWEMERDIRTPDFRAVLSGVPEPLGNDAWSGFMVALTTAFPDSKISIDGCISEGDTVATRWHLTGTHLGTFQGIPATGRAVTFNGVEYNRVADGRFAEHCSMFDNVGLLRQIGGV